MSMISYLWVSGLNTVQFGSENLPGLITETFSGSKTSRRLNRTYIIRHSAYNSCKNYQDFIDLIGTVEYPEDVKREALYGERKTPTSLVSGM
jgi:hypothetical protein